MIRTKEYIVFKKHGSKWISVKELCNAEIYSIKDAKDFLRDLKSGEINGHSANCLYKIMEVCYCDI